MKLIIKETNEIKTLEMRIWDGDQWGVDFFNDAEHNVPDGSIVSIDDYNEIISYWEDQVERHNAGEYTEQFDDPNGEEIGFFHDGKL